MLILNRLSVSSNIGKAILVTHIGASLTTNGLLLILQSYVQIFEGFKFRILKVSSAKFSSSKFHCQELLGLWLIEEQGTHEIDS